MTENESHESVDSLIEQYCSFTDEQIVALSEEEKVGLIQAMRAALRGTRMVLSMHRLAVEAGIIRSTPLFPTVPKQYTTEVDGRPG